MTTGLIDRVDAIPLRYPLPAPYGSARGLVPARQATLVRVTTSDGVVGWGETFGPPRVTAACVDELAPSIVGRPLQVPGSILAEVTQLGYHHGVTGPFTAALSGIDIALWDALGITLGVSVGRLLGGRARDRVAAYASTGFVTDPRDLGAFAAMLGEAVERGFTAAKIKIGLGLPEDRLRAEAAREALGPAGTLLVDLNANCTADGALRIIDGIADLDPAWVEEPVPPEDLDGYRELRRRVRVPVAAGEAVYTRHGFRPLIAERLVDVVQPDVAKCGGLTEAKVVLELARTWHLRVSPHVWGGAVAQAASLQLLATVPDYPHTGNPSEPLWLEFDQGANALRDAIVHEPVTAVDGWVDIPDAPGLGIRVDEDAASELRIDR